MIKKVRTTIYADDGLTINSIAFDIDWRIDLSLSEILKCCKEAIKNAE